ncbi:guanylate kinase [Enterococcus sp. LJL128]|uniref:guanylate kinase n=1 Tax=Enterococcus sp. LJL51 TaxID=3416656 RepID=UPI003CECD7D5
MEVEKINHPLYIIMGPSGSGKTKITELAFPKESKIVSYTTRKKRKGEQEGLDYYFVDREQFEELINTGKLIEYDEYDGHYYGIGVEEIVRKTRSRSAYNALTIKGFRTLAARFGNQVVPIFLDVSRENSQKRLKLRKDDKLSQEKRLAIFEQDQQIKEQLQQYKNLHVIDGNQPLEKVVEELKRIIE